MGKICHCVTSDSNHTVIYQVTVFAQMDSKLLFKRSVGVMVGVTSDVTVTFTDFFSNLLSNQ